jgi:hypothetical protein
MKFVLNPLSTAYQGQMQVRKTNFITMQGTYMCFAPSSWQIIKKCGRNIMSVWITPMADGDCSGSKTIQWWKDEMWTCRSCYFHFRSNGDLTWRNAFNINTLHHTTWNCVLCQICIWHNFCVSSKYRHTCGQSPCDYASQTTSILIPIIFFSFLYLSY